jgi:hypothetical protein
MNKKAIITTLVGIALLLIMGGFFWWNAQNDDIPPLLQQQSIKVVVDHSQVNTPQVVSMEHKDVMPSDYKQEFRDNYYYFEILDKESEVLFSGQYRYVSYVYTDQFSPTGETSGATIENQDATKTLYLPVYDNASVFVLYDIDMKEILRTVLRDT